MLLTRFRLADGWTGVGVWDDGRVWASPDPDVTDMTSLLRMDVDELRRWCDLCRSGNPVTGAVRMLPPIDGATEVWGAGVTYARSRSARMEESAEPSIYEKVYSAPRPELFFKAAAARVVGDGDSIRLRADSANTVPEPELAVVLSDRAEVLGFCVGDDVTSRSIEAENPLYLPQAKIWSGSCALGPGIRPAWEVADPMDLEIRMQIHRAGRVVFDGSATTADIRRELADLIDHLFRDVDFPAGVVLMTGTSVVPDLDFSLRVGDEVVIEISEIGALVTPVS